MRAPVGPGVRPRTGVAMPEWLTRHDVDNGTWEVRSGPPERGEAWTKVYDRIMRVPVGGDETNRLIRAHEMMHARVSPVIPIGPELGITLESILAAEEFRVNTLLGAAGFDLDALCDGSERHIGERLARIGDGAGLLRFVAGTAGGKACSDLLRGVRRVDPELARALRTFSTSLLRRWRTDARRDLPAAQRDWGNTTPVDDPGSPLHGAGQGFVDHTLPIARMLDGIIGAIEGAAGALGDDAEGLAPGVLAELITGRTGRWADEVRFGTTRLDRRVPGAVGRRRTASPTGRNPRRMHRMLTDPQRRVFDRNRRSVGSIVVIDLSGSMRLDNDDIEQMMAASPGCTIVGYSHRTAGEANAYVLARGGRRCDPLPAGVQAGNGIDGPIIEWAAAEARRGEQIVWVCDGIVTGESDTRYKNLDIEATLLVRRHGIHMTPDVTRGIEAMRRLAKDGRLPTTYVGSLRVVARSLGFVPTGERPLADR